MGDNVGMTLTDRFKNRLNYFRQSLCPVALRISSSVEGLLFSMKIL